MRLATLAASWNAARRDLRLLWTVVVVQAAALVVLAVVALDDDVSVVLVPPTLAQEGWVGRSGASPEYHQAIALYLADTLGNVRPETVAFKQEVLGRYVEPTLYGDLMARMVEERDRMKADQVSIGFEARSTTYDEATGRTFVTGISTVRSVTGAKRTETRTYEFEIRVSGWWPLVHHLRTYAGPPQVGDTAGAS